QGHVHLLDGGVHPAQARRHQDRLVTKGAEADSLESASSPQCLGMGRSCCARGAVCTNSVARLWRTSSATCASRALAGRPVSPAPTVVARSRDLFGADPEVLGHPRRLGDNGSAGATYVMSGQEVACASTQGTLSSH